jgi:hypothetical protein
MPGKVVKYDRTTNRAEIQPQLKRKFVTQPQAQDLPVLSEVPVLQARGTDAYVRLPIQVGDTGLLIFCERSIDLWLERGESVDPLDRRRHSLSDAVFLPGLFSSTTPLPATGDSSSIVIANAGVRVELLSSGKIKIQNGTGELLSAISDLLTSLLGEPFIVNKATLTQLKVIVDSLKG